MVFGIFFLGVGCGITLPFVTHNNVSKLMSVCFLHPHLKYSMEKERRDPTLAINVVKLDHYILDVFKSTLLFMLMIGPIAYKTYYLKEGEIGADMDRGQRMVKAEDSYSTMLRNMKGVKEAAPIE